MAMATKYPLLPVGIPATAGIATPLFPCTQPASMYAAKARENFVATPAFGLR